MYFIVLAIGVFCLPVGSATMRYMRFLKLLVSIAAGALLVPIAFAHGIAGADQEFVINNVGVQVGPYIYLGAKHMVTGYDHLLFLAGVIFFLYRLREVALYVTLFAVGHSTTLLIGVLGGLYVNPYIVDAIIGLSVVYKAFENLGGFKKFGFQPNMKLAVLVFGFFHGFGLSTKLQDFAISEDGLIANMLSFNVGVEIGQFLALALILIGLNIWRASESFMRYAFATNVAIMSAGFMLMGYQITGFIVS